MNGRKMTDEQFAEARRLYETGGVKSIKELAARYGMDLGGLAKRLKRAGVKMRSRGRPRGTCALPVATVDEIVRRVRAGETRVAIAASFGINDSTVCRYVQRSDRKERAA